MNTLADAVVYSILHINCATADDEREDEDVRALEWLTFTLGQCGDSEIASLKVAVARASANAEAFPWPAGEVLDALRAIERDILTGDAA